MAYHLSIFSENKPGSLEKITKIFADYHINIMGISVASGGEFGIVKLLVNDPNMALEKLKENKIIASKQPIVAVFIGDKAGNMFRLLNVLSAHQLNVEDCYGTVIDKKERAMIIIEVKDIENTQKILTENGIEVLSDSEIYAL